MLRKVVGVLYQDQERYFSPQEIAAQLGITEGAADAVLKWGLAASPSLFLKSFDRWQLTGTAEVYYRRFYDVKDQEDTVLAKLEEEMMASLASIDILPAPQQASEDPEQFFVPKGSNLIFVPSRLGDYILARVPIITMRDNDEIYYYDRGEGIWRTNGEPLIKQLCKALLAEMEKRSHIEETIYYIRAATYQNRTIFTETLNLLPVRNGVLDFQTRELRPYSPEHYFTFKLPVSYDHSATCPAIETFLAEVVEPKDILLLKEVAAYCLYRSYPIQKAVMLIGAGNNGKSVFLNVLRTLLSSDNVCSVPLQDFEKNRFSVAYLFGKLANVYADLPDVALYITGKFKMLTGGDLITAEEKFKRGFQFVNYAKLLFSCNTMPTVTDQTNAFFRRWIIVEFPNSFDNAADRNLLAKLTTDTELSGFLNLLLDVLPQLLERGDFSYALATEEIKQEYIRHSDSVGAFFMDSLEEDPDGVLPKSQLYSVYSQYCREFGRVCVPNNVFFRKLNNYGNVLDFKPSGKDKESEHKRVPSLKGVRLSESVEVVDDVNVIFHFNPMKQGEESRRVGEEKERKNIDNPDIPDAHPPSRDPPDYPSLPDFLPKARLPLPNDENNGRPLPTILDIFDRLRAHDGTVPEKDLVVGLRLVGLDPDAEISRAFEKGSLLEVRPGLLVRRDP